MNIDIRVLYIQELSAIMWKYPGNAYKPEAVMGTRMEMRMGTATGIGIGAATAADTTY